jgi:hypothetical protein
MERWCAPSGGRKRRLAKAKKSVWRTQKVLAQMFQKLYL